MAIRQSLTFCFLSLLGTVRSFEFSHGLLSLPNYQIEVNEGVKISLNDIRCHNLTVGDIEINSHGNSDIVQISADIMKIGLVCRMDLTLVWNGIQTDAQAYFETNNTDVGTQMRLEDDSLLVDECNAAMRLKEMEINGLSGVIEIFVESMRETWMGTMESAFGDAICDEFKKAIPNMLGNNIKEITALLANLAEANSQVWTPSVGKKIDNLSLVRLDEYESSIEMLIQFAWAFSGYFLNSTKEDGTLLVNSIARRWLHNDSNSYRMENLDYSFDFSNSTLGNWGVDSLNITGGSVHGLDSIVRFDDIVPTSPTSLRTSGVLQELQITIDATLYTNATVIVNGTIVDSTLTADNFQVVLNLSNIFATIDVNLELTASYLEEIRIGDLLGSPNITSCFMRAIKNISVANLHFDNVDYRAPVIMNLDPLLAILLTGSIDILLEKYVDILPDVLAHLLSNAVVEKQPPFEAAENAFCDFSSELGTSANYPYLDFRDLLLSPDRAKVAGASGDAPYGRRAYGVYDYINKELLAMESETRRPYLNEKAPTTTQSGTPGSFTFAGSKSIFKYTDSIGVGGSAVPIHLDFRSLTIENFYHWLSPMVLFQPVMNEPSELDNLVQFGMDDDPSLKFSTVVALTVGDYSSDFLIDMEIKSLSVLVNLLLYVRENPFLVYKLGDIKDGHCLASLLEIDGIQKDGRSENEIPPFDLAAFDMQLEGVKMDLRCHNCRDETTKTVATLVSGVVRSIFDEGLYLHMGYNQLAEKKEQRNVISEILQIVESRSGLLQNFLDNLIANAPEKCKRSPKYDPNAETKFASLLQSLGFKPQAASPRSEPSVSQKSSGLLIALVDLIGVVICFWIFVRAYLKYKLRRRQREWLVSLLPSQIIAIYERQEKAKNHDLTMNRCCPPIFYCNRISRSQKLIVVIALMSTIVLFLCGISNTAAAVTIDLHISNSLAYSFSVDYNLMTIVELTWESGGYFMAIATAFAVGIWPMVRQFMTLFLLFIPSAYLDIKTRGQILHLFDQLGKWTMLGKFLKVLAHSSLPKV